MVVCVALVYSDLVKGFQALQSMDRAILARESEKANVQAIGTQRAVF